MSVSPVRYASTVREDRILHVKLKITIRADWQNKYSFGVYVDIAKATIHASRARHARDLDFPRETRELST